MAEGDGRSSSVDPAQDDGLPGAKEGAFVKTLPFHLQAQCDHVVATCAEMPQGHSPRGPLGWAPLSATQPVPLLPGCLGVEAKGRPAPQKEQALQKGLGPSATGQLSSSRKGSSSHGWRCTRKMQRGVLICPQSWDL